MSEFQERLAQLSPKRLSLLAAELQAQLEANARARSEPIAIIGVGCQFPGASAGAESFWQLLRDGVDAISEVPADRWDVEAFYDPDPDAPGKMATRYGGFLPQVDRFDAHFFGISPREAASMDPHQRLLLEVAYEALEHAGVATERLAGSQTGVFVGIYSSEYADMQYADPGGIDVYAGTGNSHSVAAGRLSYFLDLHGPSVPIDTACSSALAAVHLACQSLRAGECSMALAGGVNLLLSPLSLLIPSKMRLLSEDGRCKTFDARADGMVIGEGCGVVVLKPLSSALKDGDRVLALVRGSAMNQDGRSNGLTAPNGRAQQAVIRQALENSRVAPAQVGYVEAHGTGTPLGDPIEIEALAHVYGQGRPPGRPCALGSVKTNVGHLGAAAGISGLIKAVLALQHGAIPAHLHLETLSPNIPLDQERFVIPTELRPWPSDDGPRFAAVSSFGWSGTNVHLVLEEAPPAAPSVAAAAEGPADQTWLLPISAQRPEALRALAERYEALLGDYGQAPALPDICYTASVRRRHHQHRLAVAGRSGGECAAQLRAFLGGQRDAPAAGVAADEPPGVVFVFPGQGGQWLGMGRQLLAAEPVFRAAIEACERAFAPHVSWSLVDELQADPAQSRLAEIDVVQPALFAVQVALAALWRSWGVEPDAVVGHSMGEAAAAHVAGALSLEDAAAVICRRSRLLRRVRGQGAMALVELSVEQARRALAGSEGLVSIAVSNSPRLTVLSGDQPTLAALLETLQRQQVFGRWVQVDVASHSPQMEPLLPELRELLRHVRPRAATTPIYSTVTGARATGLEFDAAYWAQNLRQPVLFADAVQRLIDAGNTTFVELSPHPTLLPSVTDGLRHAGRPGAALPSLRREEDERGTLLGSVGALYSAGYAPDWRRVYGAGGSCVDLPAYPWQEQRYWIEPRSHSPRAAQPQPRRPEPAAPADSNVIVDLYDALSERQVSSDAGAAGDDAEQLVYLTWGVFPRPVPGFSWLKAAFFPHDHPTQSQLLVEAQRRTRRLLFRNANFAAIARVLDLGCGHASDLIELAERYDHLALDGYTLSARQVELGMRHARARGLADRIRLYRRDSAKNAFPGRYELIIGIEVAGLIEDKDALWANVAEHLENGGLIVLADFIANTRSPIEVHDTSTFSSTAEQWAATLARHHLRIVECVDVSPEIAHCLEDPDYHATLAEIGGQLGLSELELRNFGSYQNVRKALERKLISYALFTVQKDAFSIERQIARDNSERLASRLSYAEAAASISEADAQSELGEWFHEIEWQRDERPAPAVRPADATAGWLVLADEGGAGENLRRHLEQRGERCVLVYRGSEDQHVRDDRYRIALERPEAFQQLLKDAFPSGASPCRGVIHLWSLDAPPPSEAPASLEAARDLTCTSALYLVQALARAGWRDAPRLWLVTRGAQAVGPQPDPASFAQAALWGLGSAIVHEHPELGCARVDLSPAGGPEELELLAAYLGSDDREDQIALRGGARYLARLAPSAAPAAPPASFRPDGTYLITGGLRGVGLSIAQGMVERGARHLLLIGRSAPAPEASAAIAALREAGAQVVVASADVSQADQLAGVLAMIDNDMPPLRGVVHSAVVLDDGTLLQQTRERFATVFAPKVEGAWNLHLLTRERELDFFVLFSSLASLLGSPAQGNYAAANAAVDALAHYRRAQGLSALCINWAPWSRVGLAVTNTNWGERLAHRGLLSITPDQGAAMFCQLLATDAAQVAVMRLHLRQWRQFYPRSANLPLLAGLAAGQAAEGEAAEQGGALRGLLLARAPGAERQSLLETHLQQQLAQVLRLEPAQVDAQVQLRAFGFDSLMAVELRNRLEVDLGLTLSATLVWSYPTIAALAAHLLQRLGMAPEQGAEPAAAPEAGGRPALDDADAALVDDLLEDLQQHSAADLRDMLDGHRAG